MFIKKEIINYSLKSLQKRKTRSLLTILSIFIGIAAIFIFVSFGLGLYAYINSFSTSTSADKLTIMPKGNSAPGLSDSFALTDKDIKSVEKASGIYEATGLHFKAAEIKQKDIRKYVFLVSYDPSKPLFQELTNVKVVEGRDLSGTDEGKAVLGYNYKLDDSIFPRGYHLGDSIEVNGQKIRIIGFLDSVGNPQDDSQIYITNDYFKTLYPNVTSYAEIIARADINDMDGAVSRVEKNLRNSRDQKEGEEDFFVASFQDLIAQYTSALNIVIGFVILIALISVLVSAVNTANTMITSVMERTREIGTMKAVGARNNEILKIFLFESAFLGFLAGVIGTIFGFIISYSVGKVLENLGWGFLSPGFPWYLFVGTIAFATITGAISGIWPAYRASRLRTVEALRYE